MLAAIKNFDSMGERGCNDSAGGTASDCDRLWDGPRLEAKPSTWISFSNTQTKVEEAR